MADSRNKVLRVEKLIATRSGDADRGPAVYMNADDARSRLLEDGELAWIHGPRRNELAVVHVSPDQQRGDVCLRDVLGASPSELIRVVKPDLDRGDRFRERLKRRV